MADMTSLISGVDTSRSRRVPRVGLGGDDPYTSVQGSGDTSRVKATSQVDPNAPAVMNALDPTVAASMQSDFMRRQAVRKRQAAIGQGLFGGGGTLLSNPAITRKNLIGA